MTHTRTIVLGIVAAALSLMTTAPDAAASYTNLIGTLANYTTVDIWEVKCPGQTDELSIRAVATYSSTFLAIATALTPAKLYGQGVSSEVFQPGGVGSEVVFDRPGQGRMKLLVTVKQTGGLEGDTYYVNIACFGTDIPPKIELLQNG